MKPRNAALLIALVCLVLTAGIIVHGYQERRASVTPSVSSANPMRLYTRRFLKPYNEVVVPDDGDKRALAHIAAKRLEREQKMREAVGMRRLRLMKPMKRIFAEQIPSGDPAAHSGDVLLKSVELATNANKLQLGVLPVR